ncbi:MAG TPA: hypothetical protein VKN99_27805 [Polyangia bacterium]|nr:hypothetical protein [Polyangia bacterium]
MRIQSLFIALALALTLAAPTSSALAVGVPKRAGAEKTAAEESARPIKNQKLSDFARQRPRDERGRFLPLGAKAAAPTTRANGSSGERATSTLSSNKTSSLRGGQSGGLRNWLTRNFTVRTQVSNLDSSTREKMRQGELHAAADGLTKSRVTAQGFRERLMLGSLQQDLTDTSLGQIRARSAAGDTLGTEDARQSLTQLKASGRLDWWTHWRAARAENRAFKNVISAANQAGRQGNLARAQDNLVYASDLRGPSNVKVARATGRFFRHSMSAADQFAWNGDPESTSQALGAAQNAAAAGGGTFNEARAKKLMHRAFERAVPNLLYQARLYKNSSPIEAALFLEQAMEIQKAEGVRLGFLDRRRQSALLAQLGPRIRANQAARAQGGAQTQAKANSTEDKTATE